MGEDVSTEYTSTDPRSHSTCLTRFARSIKTDPTVIHMLISMHEAGFPVKISRDFACEPCSPRVAGGFDPRRQQIVLCENNIYSQIHMNEVLTHELVHSFDDKSVNLDWHDLKHLACTEVRAANLSGECSFSKENFIRFNFGFKSHNRECVKHRAAQSISTVKEGVSYDQAREIIDSVFDQCYSYTRPFQGIPPLSPLKSTRWQFLNYFNSEKPFYYEE
ncbi:Mitochondrial inner membrane protease ATP23-like [Oopsacas minuta]|uniref:Mitochondrial inner membrane protease ATP23 n=1 Tax=Oopsacas minuta TaxID=111878 RepID=A0AAV7JZ99_9METZ|nr:Mitochondrial inner membrane protease ATP23-like [Oopsacas minuta]